MSVKSTFSTSYYCRDSKQNRQGLSPLELCININGKRLFVNLPSKFNPKEFNRKRRPQYIEDVLTQFRIKTNEVLSELMHNGLPITASTVREYMKTGGIKSKTLEDLCNDYLNVIKSRIGKSITPTVYKKYELVCNFLCSIFNKDKEVCSFNKENIVMAYEELKMKYLPSTSAGYMTKIKTIFTYAIDNGWLKTNPFSGIKIDKGESRVEFLTNEEINKIKQLDIVDYPRLEKVRDLMLFQASIGLAYIDLVLFDIEKIEVLNNTVVYANRRQKTNIEFTAVILPMGLQILKKYDGKLPLISNQKYNSYLKEIQKLAGIKTVITTHLLRKTYAHYMLNSGVRIETVARLLGHSNSLITQKIYCRKTTETIAKEIEGLNLI